MEGIETLVYFAAGIFIIFGIISAVIIKKRGYGTGTVILYFFIGFTFTIIGLLLAVLKKDLSKPENNPYKGNGYDELKRLQVLYDSGELTREEYYRIRADIVKRF